MENARTDSLEAGPETDAKTADAPESTSSPAPETEAEVKPGTEAADEGGTETPDAETPDAETPDEAAEADAIDAPSIVEEDEEDAEDEDEDEEDLGEESLVAALNAALADVFALYVKTKNFQWHVSGPHFRDYHLLLDDQSAEINCTVDAVADRVRKIGGTTIRSIGEIARLQRVKDNDDAVVAANDMLAELRVDNLDLVESLLEAHDIADELDDVATEGLIENWIDQAQGRAWFLQEASRGA